MTDNRTTELLPCPFCGGEARMRRVDFPDGDAEYVFDCACGRKIIETASKVKAVTVWNTRAELGRLNATSSQESIVRSFLRKISPNRDWDYLGEHEHAMIADLVDDIAATLVSGTLTAEQVEKVIHDCSTYASYDGCTYYASGIRIQAIADELNATLGSGTCEVEYVNDWMGWHCKSCDTLWQGLPDQKPSYCMRCGKAVER